MVNADLIEDLLNKLEDNVGKLEDLATLSSESFLADFKNVESAKHLVQVSVQICLDISNHIVASEGHRPPENYADTFKVLAENGVIPVDFLPIARKMVGFRNRLVHLYWHVDDEVLLEVLHDDLGHFATFARHIGTFLARP